ncbi:MAG: phosphate signaling complex protein PhoU [Pirellulaceae bacterium]
MSVHLQREIENLKKRLLSLCAMVEEQVATATQSLAEGDEERAKAVELRDAEVDRRDVDLEEECLQILALHQPVANDLRFVVAVLKVNSDLERIGDLAVNIARKASSLAHEHFGVTRFDLPTMSDKTRIMLRYSIDALVNGDTLLARQVCALDDEVDDMKRLIRRRVEQLLSEEPARVHSLLSFLAVTRNLERISDHATNIAEAAIYMVEGRIIRHGAIQTATNCPIPTN